MKMNVRRLDWWDVNDENGMFCGESDGESRVNWDDDAFLRRTRRPSCSHLDQRRFRQSRGVSRREIGAAAE